MELEVGRSVKNMNCELHRHFGSQFLDSIFEKGIDSRAKMVESAQNKRVVPKCSEDELIPV